MPGMTLKIRKEDELHQRLLEELSSRVTMAEGAHSGQWDKWDQADKIVNAYVPESADDLKRHTARDVEGRPAYTTIKLPYTYALLMAAHTYWTSVFFGRSPVHQFSGRHGATEQQTQALEALISYQTDVGGHLAPYYLWTYDAGKYGIGILGTYWEEETNYVTTMKPDPTMQDAQVYVTVPLKGYCGNKIYNISPWDFLPDPRVSVSRFQEGEFVAIYREIPWNVLKAREQQGYYTNLDKIPATGSSRTKGGGQWLERPKTPDTMIGYSKSKHPAWVGAYEVYVTLTPKEWQLGSGSWSEKWVFTITSDKTLIIGAQPLGLFHNKYPFSVWQSEPEAYGLWTRGIPEIVEPIQNTMDWLINTHFFNVRAIANGRFVADPSKIDLSQLEGGEPGWIAMLRPEAWGTVSDIDQVFKQIQMTDPTSQHFNDFERMFQIGERTTGINDQILGALSGGRKTATEVRTTTGFGVNRLKTASEYMSAMGFAPHAQLLVQNTQQYQRDEITVRIVGDLLRTAGPGFMKVDPSMIAGFYDFVPIDGTLPVDRFAQATLWKDMLGQMRAIPQLMAQFDLGRIFTWVAGLAGLKNLDQFRIAGPEVQVLPDEQLQREAEKGNVIPFQGSGSAGASAGPQSNVATIPTTNFSQ